MLTSDLAKWPQLEVVARKALGPVLREQWIQHQGFSSSDPSVGVGSLKGAHYLLQGVFSTHNNRVTIHVQVIDVETGLIRGSVKTNGLDSEIPLLEQDLVNQILQVFNDSLRLKIPSHSGGIDAENQRGDLEMEPVKKRLQDPFSAGPAVPPISLQIDALLNLEKVTYERKAAYQLAETIWREGWLMERGQPYNQIWQLSSPVPVAVPTINIPVSLYFSPARLEGIFEKSGKIDGERPVRLDSDELIFIHEDSGTQQIFDEHFHQPRRIFIRALNEQGDVLALFSQWTWHTERILPQPAFHRVAVPMWPNALISGVAHFPVAWLEGEEIQVVFDAVVLPVPDEHVLVALDPIKEVDTDEHIPLDRTRQEEDVLQSLQRMILAQWTPAIAEALPSPGYLPGNTRTAVGMIHLQNGKIHQVLFQNWPEDPVFMRSLEDLQEKLINSCINCAHTGRHPHSQQAGLKIYRLQLTLVKDIQALQLGSHSH